MTYTEINGNLFDYMAQRQLVHCISSDFALGAGIAKTIDQCFNTREILNKNYPDYMSVYAKVPRPEQCCLVTDNICNLVTKGRYWQKPTLATMKRALDGLKIQCQRRKIYKLAMPAIGCGLDRLNWQDVSKLIQNTFKDTNIDILAVLTGGNNHAKN